MQEKFRNRDFTQIMFGRKKKEETTPSDALSQTENTKESKKRGDKQKGAEVDLLPATEVALSPSGKKKKKIFSKKMLLIFLVFVAVGIAAFVVYKIYFVKKSGDQRVYIQQELPNIILAEEVVRFTYDFIPELYDSMILFNNEVILLEQEIKRLAAIGEQFPDQIKISEKEMKLFEKEKTKLQQTYEKLEKRIEALYVAYRVNQETGVQQIEEQKQDIIQSTKDALAPSLELTKRLQLTPEEKIPDGFVKATIYKIRQKINTLMK